MGKRLLALLLICCILSNRSISAATEPWTSTEELTEDVAYSQGYFADGDRQAEHYLVYQPGGNVYPAIWYGSTLGQRDCFGAAMEQIEAQGKRVIAGTNGDYYVVATGQPVGLVISEGRLITSDGGNPALGFLPDGAAFFGSPSLRMALSIHGEEYRLAGVNKPIHDGDFFLYTPDFGEHTPLQKKARNLILVPEGDLRVGTEITLRVESVRNSAGAISIPEGKWVLCLTEDSDEWRKRGVESLAEGDTVTLSIFAEDERWSKCTSATGSLYTLLVQGEIPDNLDRIDDKRAPRTAVGIREDGTILFYTVDGRQSPYSAGLSLRETAQRLLELGCLEAGALDGGGSTALYAQAAGEEDSVLRSRPSDGQEREVSTYLLLVTEGEGSGEIRSLSLRSGAEAVLCGGNAQLMAGICDEKGNPVNAITLNWSASDGKISADGLYTAPDHPCLADISVEANGLSSHIWLPVIESPDTLTLLNQKTGKEVNRLELERRETVDLAAEATWGLLWLTAEDEEYTWTASGDAGSIDESGRFTASANGGTGAVTVSAGTASLTVGVFVPTTFTCMTDLEQEESGELRGLSWQRETLQERVRFGSGSLRMTYDLNRGADAYPVSWNTGESAHYLYLWVYGDGSDNDLYLRQGEEKLLVTRLDYTGWRLLTVDTGYAPVSGVSLEGEGSGTIWLDQVLASNSAVPDLEPPVIRISADGSSVTAGISDQTDGYPAADAIELTLDGEILPFAYSESSGILRAALTGEDELRRLKLTVWDSSGNYNTAAVMLPGFAETPFADMEGHWAETYTAYLCRRGVVTGKEKDGALIFDPNAPVTRTEFAVLLCRWLGLTAPEGEIPVFADAEKIPAWAQSYVYIAASRGLIQGVQEGDSLYFDPSAPLTRAQAATILGRTLTGGSPCADLVYSDAESIPSWAAQHISRLAFLGVFSGFEDNSFRPGDTLTRAQAAKLLTEMS